METLAISGIGKRNGLLEILRPLAAEHGLAILGMDAEEWPSARVEVDHFVRLTKAHDLDFLERYISALKEHNAIGHLTLVDPEIPVLGRAPATDSRYLNPVFDTSILCEDKFAFHVSLDSVGIPTVPTYLSPLPTLPFIVKDRRGSAASGFRIFGSGADTKELPSVVEKENSVYQPFVDGAHLCVDALFSLGSGNLVDLCVKKVVAKKHGESFLVESVKPGAVIELVNSVSRHLSLRGIVNFDIYQMTHPDDLVLMEVNCRIGGNYPASHLLGCDMVTTLLSELRSGRAPPPFRSPRYEVGRRVGKYYGFTNPF